MYVDTNHLIQSYLLDCELDTLDSPIHFPGANLAKIHLQGAYLVTAKVSAVNLSGANLSQAILSWGDLSHANLVEANLSHANLVEANLSGAYLQKAYLQKANLIATNWSNAKLESANIQGAIYSDTTLFPPNFNPQNRGAYLIAANANIDNLDIRDLDLSSLVELESVRMQGAIYSETTLFPPNFNPQNKGAYLIAANIAILNEF